MLEAGHAIRGGGAFVEDPFWCAFPLLDRAFEDAMRGPAGQFGLLEGDEIGIGWDRCEHASSMVFARVR